MQQCKDIEKELVISLISTVLPMFKRFFDTESIYNSVGKRKKLVISLMSKVLSTVLRIRDLIDAKGVLIL